MKKHIIFLFLIISLFLIIFLINKLLNNNMTIIVSSPNFSNNGFIPEKYSCKGENINPELTISNIPKNAKTIVLIVDDPDAPNGVWVHWIMWNIPITSTIQENSVLGVQGLNSWGKNEYGGPCPPSGTHRYYFKIYALDKKLNISKNSNKEQLINSMKGSILDKGELVGLFNK